MKWLVKVIFKAVKMLINLICLPFDAIISNLFPNTTYAIGMINSFFNWVIDFIKWVLSWLPFTGDFYAFLILALVFYYTVPMLTHTIKIVINWYNTLKP